MAQRCLLQSLLRIACQIGICIILYKSMAYDDVRRRDSALSALSGGHWVSFAGELSGPEIVEKAP